MDKTGLKILSVYMTGSKNMSYDSASLTTSDIKVPPSLPRLCFALLFTFQSKAKGCSHHHNHHHHQPQWLGVRPSDLDRYNLPEQCRLDMTEFDIRTGTRPPPPPPPPPRGLMVSILYIDACGG